MAELKKCRACGVDVPSNAPFGHCPKCLLELGFGAMPKDAVEPADHSALRTPNSALETVRYFGDYELLEQIGRGGMGIVYKARQQSLNRVVALKMISAGEFASPSSVQRFQIEAEATAKLDHPNIVPIYEIGVHRGQHYFSMGFVEGRSLAEEIRDGKFRFVSGANKARKSAARQQQFAIARLMAIVARSVHHAHRYGILHRDLKPGNILLDGGGQPHLTDFGLAKILEHEVGVSDSTSVLGTPGYMSPEQANARPLTTATDVYSLGAILYELLTGRPPFSGATPMEIFQQLAQEEPAHPQSLNLALDRDLATICLKCLEKDPAKRYPSADALADELTRFLGDEPITARSVSRREKVWRWCKRKPALAGALSGLVVVFVLGFVGVSWQWWQAKANERTAIVEATTRQHVATFLEETFNGVRPSVALGRDTTLLREILDRAAARMAKDLKNQPQAEAWVRNTVGVSYLELGEYRKAEAMFRESLAIEKRLHGPDHLHVTGPLDALGRALQLQGRFAEAETMHRDALAIARKQPMPEQTVIAAYLYDLAGALQGQAKLTEAEARVREALAIRKALFGAEHLEAANTFNLLAGILSKQGKFRESEAMFRASLTIQKKFFGEEHPDVTMTLGNIATLLQEQGKLQQAETIQREVLAIDKRIFGDRHPTVARGLHNLGLILMWREKWIEAEAASQQALLLRKQSLGSEHPDVLESLNSLAALFQLQGKFAEAEAMYREVLVKEKKLFNNEHPHVASALYNLALVLQEQGKYGEAGPLHQEALSMQRKLLGNEHPNVADSLTGLAKTFHHEKKFAEAEALIREALALYKKSLGNEHEKIAASQGNLGSLLENQGRSAEAADLYSQALAIRRKVFGNDHPKTIDSLIKLGSALETAGKLPEAETTLREALDAARKVWTNAPLKLKEAMYSLAGVLEQERKRAEAEPLLLEANALLENSDQVPTEEKREAMKTLSRFYTAWAVEAPNTGKIQKSLEWGRKAAGFDSGLKEREALARAETGDARSQFELGEAFYDGQLGAGRNYAEAVKWFRKAAEQNHAEAQSSLGFCYANGQGVTKDE